MAKKTNPTPAPKTPRVPTEAMIDSFDYSPDDDTFRMWLTADLRTEFVVRVDETDLDGIEAAVAEARKAKKKPTKPTKKK